MVTLDHEATCGDRSSAHDLQLGHGFGDAVAENKAVPQRKIVSGTPVTAGCRMIKSDHELELMSLANKVTLAAYQAAYQALHEGMTRPKLEKLIMAANERLGFPGEVDIDIGENSSFP